MIHPANPESIARAAERLRGGELVAFPTETVYGLGAHALDARAVAKIFALKGRPHSSPLIVHVASLAQAKSLATSWPPAAEALAQRFWPGPLTLVLPKNPQVPDLVTACTPTVGLRWPAHPVAQALLEAAQIPLAAPSANRFTQLSPTTAEHVRRSLGDELFILDGGPTDVGLESTVVSLTAAQPRLLRPGMVSQPEIEAIVGPLLSRAEEMSVSAAPGLHPQHYQPRTPLYLVPSFPAVAEKNVAFLALAGQSAPEFARTLYAKLHELDQQGWDAIAVEQPPPGPEWDAVRDRLFRAAKKD